MKDILLTLFLFISGLFFAQSVTKPSKEHHQFDFWLGKWEVYKMGQNDNPGKSTIESINDSLGLLEHYIGPLGRYYGKSLSNYNSVKQRWEQYWIDNSGLTLLLVGGIKDGKMVLCDEFTGDPKQGINQITWELMKNGNVKQTWNLSKDGGKTWTTLFDGEYKKVKNN